MKKEQSKHMQKEQANASHWKMAEKEYKARKIKQVKSDILAFGE